MPSSPFELERSLLQKAVRRGNEYVIDKVFRYLLLNDNKLWLKKRLVVMGYEECWTFANKININCSNYEILEQYKTLARKIKNKNADGLADLARKLNEYEYSALVGNEQEQKAIQSVANSMKYPEKYWKWIRTQPLCQGHKFRIEQAKRDVNKKTISDDSSMMYAAAYLAVKYLIPETQSMEPDNDPNFPYWIAVDKHTSIGREAYIEACNSINLSPVRGMHLGFYLEGGVCNKVIESPFWDHMVNWYLNHIHFTMNEAKEKWEELKPILIDLTKDSVNEMLDRINNLRIESDQLELFE
jgi:hypothetical protein